MYFSCTNYLNSQTNISSYTTFVYFFLASRIITQRVSNPKPERASTQRVSNPKGLKLLICVSCPDCQKRVYSPRWSTFLVHSSFLSPKGAVDCQFKKSGFPAIHIENLCAKTTLAPAQRTRCLIFLSYVLCFLGCSFSSLRKAPSGCLLMHCHPYGFCALGLVVVAGVSAGTAGLAADRDPINPWQTRGKSPCQSMVPLPFVCSFAALSIMLHLHDHSMQFCTHFDRFDGARSSSSRSRGKISSRHLCARLFACCVSA